MVYDAPHGSQEVRDFFEAWTGTANRGDWTAFAELMHPDIVLADPMSPEPAIGRGEALRRAQQQYAPFPDGRTEVIGEPFTAGDAPVLAYRWRFVGTHLEPVVPPGFAATGDTVAVDGVSVLRFQEGKVVEATLFFDTTDVARQLLAAPPAGSPLERVVAGTQRLRVGLRRLRRGRNPRR